MARKEFSEEEKKRVTEIVSRYVDLQTTPFGKPVRGPVRVDKRQPMYGGNGTVYLFQMFGEGELVNNRIGAYMVLLTKNDEAGFHTHGTRKEQELYIIMHGEGKYMDRDGAFGETRTQKVKKGSVTAVRGSGFHAIRNTGDEPLIVFVITTNEA